MSDEPLGELGGLEDDDSADDFVRRVLRRVDRRQMTADLIGFGFEMPRQVVVEAAKVLTGLPELLRAITKGGK